MIKSGRSPRVVARHCTSPAFHQVGEIHQIRRRDLVFTVGRPCLSGRRYSIYKGLPRCSEQSTIRQLASAQRSRTRRTSSFAARRPVTRAAPPSTCGPDSEATAALRRRQLHLTMASCSHEFLVIKTDTTLLLWYCSLCYSGPHWLIYECKFCKIKRCKPCTQK